VIGIACALLAACSHQVPTAATTHQDRWDLRGVSSYDIVYSEGGVAGTCRLLVRVRRDRVASAVTQRQSAWLDPKDAQTIDGVFSKLRSVYRDSDKVTAT
jgi:hypothetical protein